VETQAPILIVEDDDLVRSFLARALVDVSDRIDVCGTAAEATRAVRGNRYGTILLDGLLPDVHGVDLGRQLVRLPPAASSGICFVSGSLRRAVPIRGGGGALHKPRRLRELTNAVAELMLWHESAADPTGCGDVWGATCFSRLLAGDRLLSAITAAHRAAGRNLHHRGATGLAHYLRGELSLS